METLKNFGIEIKKDNYQEVAIYGLARIYSLIDKEISAYLRPYNLSIAKFNALMVIKHIGKDKGLSQIEIGRRLIVTASNMTRLLDKLAKEGFIKRLSQESDRRVNIIKIMKKGSDILDKVWPGYYKKIIELTNGLDKEDLKQITNLMSKWYEQLERNI